MLLQELVEDQVFSLTLVAGHCVPPGLRLPARWAWPECVFTGLPVRAPGRKTQTRLQEMVEIAPNSPSSFTGFLLLPAILPFGQSLDIATRANGDVAIANNAICWSN